MRNNVSGTTELDGESRVPAAVSVGMSPTLSSTATGIRSVRTQASEVLGSNRGPGFLTWPAMFNGRVLTVDDESRIRQDGMPMSRYGGWAGTGEPNSEGEFGRGIGDMDSHVGAFANDAGAEGYIAQGPVPLKKMRI